MLTLAEYLWELKLMKQQYGQEEDLYPLIYMVLWKKFGDLSVRVVEKGNGESELKEFFSGYKGGYDTCPDMVVLDEKFDKKKLKECEQYRYGCIEVKTFVVERKHDVIFNILEEIEQNRREILLEPKYRPVAYVDVYNRKPGNKRYTLKRKLTFERDNPIQNNEFNVYEKEMKCSEIKGFLEEKGFSNNSSKKDLEDIPNEDNNIKMNLRMAKKLIQVTANDKSYKLDRDIKEFVNELCWYRKVLYTNGLRWFYIDSKQECEKNNGKISLRVNCTEIGNLKEMFESVKSVDAVGRQVTLSPEWQQEWARLKYNLACIDWTGTNNSSKFS